VTKRIPIDDRDPLLHRPFSGLPSSGVASAPPQLAVQATPELPRPPLPKSGPAWAVVRIERKGRGGKEVTVVEKLELRSSELDRWTKSLKQHLGCGGVVEGRAIVLQGDQRARTATWLEAKGVRKVTLG
jgi:translation initiation factor 1